MMMRRRRRERRGRERVLALCVPAPEMWCRVCDSEGGVWEVLWLLKNKLRGGAGRGWMGGVEL
jgi:hypothetical protein